MGPCEISFIGAGMSTSIVIMKSVKLVSASDEDLYRKLPLFKMQRIIICGIPKINWYIYHATSIPKAQGISRKRT